MPVVSGSNAIAQDGLRSSANTKGDKRMESPDSAMTRVSVILRSYARLRHLASDAYRIGAYVAFCELVRAILPMLMDLVQHLN